MMGREYIGWRYSDHISNMKQDTPYEVGGLPIWSIGILLLLLLIERYTIRRQELNANCPLTIAIFKRKQN